jgi:hypothetical protein
MKPRRRPQALVRARGLVLSLGCALFAAIVACGGDEPEQTAATQAARSASGEPAPTPVDSILPIEEALRRFRETLGLEPKELRGGARSRDALVSRFVEALATRDTAAFVDMLMNADEFAWLYYPHTRYTSPPYRQAPALVWFQLQNATSRGLGRLLARLGGRSIEVAGHRCAPVPLVQGATRIWEHCVLRVDTPGGEPTELRLFGSILERDDIFKFVSYANDF